MKMVNINLYISKCLVDEAGGEIAVNTDLIKDKTTFTFTMSMSKPEQMTVNRKVAANHSYTHRSDVSSVLNELNNMDFED